MKPVYINLAPIGAAYGRKTALNLARRFADKTTRALLESGRFALRVRDAGARYVVTLESV